MKKIKSIFFILVISITLQSCGTLKEGFKSQKKNSTDEFLVEKKSPLVMPPEFDELPMPKSEIDKNSSLNVDSSKNIEKLITNGAEIDSSLEQNKNFENLIIDQIKSN